ncbi:hypothetical protein EDB85DRAFT_1572590 [Lactarius pseudohatsudake]|nr:hypothetical protein EDB85DRAFT_1572590 [Lactarius pseudohatsudake]
MSEFRVTHSCSWYPNFKLNLPGSIGWRNPVLCHTSHKDVTMTTMMMMLRTTVTCSGCVHWQYCLQKVPPSSGSRSNMGAIAGGVASGVITIAATAGLVFVKLRFLTKATACTGAGPRLRGQRYAASAISITDGPGLPRVVDHTRGSLMLYSEQDQNNPSTYPRRRMFPLCRTTSTI